jgi:hypothetical protein
MEELITFDINGKMSGSDIAILLSFINEDNTKAKKKPDFEGLFKRSDLTSDLKYRSLAV